MKMLIPHQSTPQDALVIGAKLDANAHGESCRLAFYGRLLWILDHTNPSELSRLRVYKVGLPDWSSFCRPHQKHLTSPSRSRSDMELLNGCSLMERLQFVR